MVDPAKAVRISDLVLVFGVAVYLLGQTEIGQNNMDEPLVPGDLWLIVCFTVVAHLLVWCESRTTPNGGRDSR